MKIVVAYITIFLVSMLFLVTTDIITGMKFTTAVDVLKESFSVTPTTGYVLIAFLLSCPILTPIVTFVKHRKKTKSLRNPK